MRENMLENIDDFKVSEVCRRFDELKDLGYDEEKMIEDVLFDDDFGYCLEEEVYEIYEYWKKDRNYKETHRKLKMYCVDVSDEGSEFELRFEVNGKIVDRKVEYCMDDVLYDSYEFFKNNCDRVNFDGRFDEFEINISYKY